MKKHILISLLYFTIFITLSSCSMQAQESISEKPVFVKTTTIKVKPISKVISVSGKLFAQEEILLSFKTGGLIEKIMVNSGSKVKKGQLLAQLDLIEISAQKEQAESAFKKSERDFNRFKKLFQDSVVTLEQMQNIETAYQIAKSNLEIAVFNLKHSQIYAPANGRILSRFQDEDELVAPGIPVLAFGDTEGSYVMKAGVADKDIFAIQIGDSANVLFDAFPGRIFTAELTQIAGSANPMNGTFEVELLIKSGSDKFLSGLIGKVTIFSNKKDFQQVIPISAVLEASGKSGFVFELEKDNRVKKTKIRFTEIAKNAVILAANQPKLVTLITEGNTYLKDGSLVNIVE